MPGASASAPSALSPGPGCERGSGAESLVFLGSTGSSEQGWPNLCSAPNRGWTSSSTGMASAAFPGGASPGFSGVRARSSQVAGPGTWTLELKRPGQIFPSGQERSADAQAPLLRASQSAGASVPTGKGRLGRRVVVAGCPHLRNDACPPALGKG